MSPHTFAPIRSFSRHRLAAADRLLERAGVFCRTSFSASHLGLSASALGGMWEPTPPILAGAMRPMPLPAWDPVDELDAARRFKQT